MEYWRRIPYRKNNNIPITYKLKRICSVSEGKKKIYIYDFLAAEVTSERLLLFEGPLVISAAKIYVDPAFLTAALVIAVYAKG